MNEFLLNISAGVIASLIFCLLGKIFTKVKGHSMRKSDLRVEFKFTFRLKK
ncbi:TPA: type I toxin-antitoxin system toxin [Clostridioides difficile]